jgi:hypothetical protein
MSAAVSATTSRVLRLRDGSIAPQYGDYADAVNPPSPSGANGSLNDN